MNTKLSKNFAFILPSIGVACIILYALTAGKPIWILQSLAIFLFLGGAAYVGGGLLGFLFGIPKVVKSKNHEESYTPNTNLEDVSDWLTKILLGVGLTQIDEIFNWLHKVSTYAASDLYALGDESVFIASLIVYFVVSGFISGYLGTRIILPSVFNQSDNTLLRNNLNFEESLSVEDKAELASSETSAPFDAPATEASSETPPVTQS